jgi:hypothetical protein
MKFLPYNPDQAYLRKNVACDKRERTHEEGEKPEDERPDEKPREASKRHKRKARETVFRVHGEGCCLYYMKLPKENIVERLFHPPRRMRYGSTAHAPKK